MGEVGLFDDDSGTPALLLSPGVDSSFGELSQLWHRQPSLLPELDGASRQHRESQAAARNRPVIHIWRFHSAPLC